MRFQGTVYRALSPKYAHEPLSGEGSLRYGGRFNLPGTACLYTSSRPEIAGAEANQGVGWQPITLVSFAVDIKRVIDLRSEALAVAEGLAWADIDCPKWQLIMKTTGTSPSQKLATQLIAAGHWAALFPSFRPAALPDDFNLVLWRWDTTSPHKVELIDDENRLRQVQPLV